MTKEAAIKVFGQLLDAFDNSEHGDYFYDFGDMVCEAANVAISALREQPQWISVEEALPEPDTDVLTRRSIGTMDVEVYHEDEAAWTWDGYSKGFVTHWMTLPEPPEVEG